MKLLWWTSYILLVLPLDFYSTATEQQSLTGYVQSALSPRFYSTASVLWPLTGYVAFEMVPEICRTVLVVWPLIDYVAMAAARRALPLGPAAPEGVERGPNPYQLALA